MAIVVEHDKRRKEILQKSLDVFVQEGYEDVTFQKIADRCGITRTTLYIYFKNKHEIFLGSIKELLSDLEVEIIKYIDDENISCEETLKLTLKRIIKKCEESRTLFRVLLSYIIQIKKTGVDVNQRIKRRVLRVRHHLTAILIKGIKNGEFKELNIREMNELVYGIVESAIFRLAVLYQEDISDLNGAIDLAVDSLLLDK